MDDVGQCPPSCPRNTFKNFRVLVAPIRCESMGNARIANAPPAKLKDRGFAAVESDLCKYDSRVQGGRGQARAPGRRGGPSGRSSTPTV